MAKKRSRMPQDCDPREEAALVAALAEANREPLTDEDRAWFDSLPDAPSLPTRPGETVAVFFQRRQQPGSQRP
jgi:hypothetical protein